jgi:hypothetical protein
MNFFTQNKNYYLCKNTMDTLVIHSEPTKIKAIVELLKAFDISFELKISKESKDSYDPDFVSMVEENRENYKKGVYKKVELDDIVRLN